MSWCRQPSGVHSARRGGRPKDRAGLLNGKVVSTWVGVKGCLSSVYPGITVVT